MSKTKEKRGDAAKRRDTAKIKERHYTKELRTQRHELYSIVATVAVMAEFFLCTFAFSNKYYDITDARSITTMVLAALSIVALFCVFFRFKSKKRMTPLDTKEALELTTVADWGMALYLVTATVSAILSQYPQRAIIGAEGRFDGLLTQYAYATLYFMASRLYKHKPWFNAAFSIIVFAFTAMGVLQFFGVNIFGMYGPENNLYKSSFMSLYGNTNIVSTVSGLMTVYFGLLFIKSDSKFMPVYGAAACCAFFTQAIAGSDSGWVNVATGFIFMIPFIFVNRKRILRLGMLLASLGITGFLHDWLYENVVAGTLEHAKPGAYSTLNELWLAVAALGAILWLAAFIIGKKVKIKPKLAMILSWALVALILVMGVAGIEILGSMRTTGNIYQAREMLHGNMADEFMTWRGYIWRTSLGLIKYSPIIGSGPDSLGVLHQTVYGDEGVELMGQVVDKAHNEYIQYAVCEGIVGLLGYLVCVGGVLVLWVKRGRWRDGQPDYIYAAGGAVAAYLCQAFFNLSVPIAAPYFFIFLGFAANRQTLDAE